MNSQLVKTMVDLTIEMAMDTAIDVIQTESRGNENNNNNGWQQRYM